MFSELTPGVEEAGLPAAVDHFLLAVFRAADQDAQLLGGGAVVEACHMGALWRGAVHAHPPTAVVLHHRPHSVLCTPTNTRKSRLTSPYKWLTKYGLLFQNNPVHFPSTHVAID